MNWIQPIRLALARWPIFLLFSGVFFQPAPAAEGIGNYSLRTWQTEDGLPQNSVHCIAQTPDGFLWLGTSEGLVRFDGLSFTTFSPANSPGMNSQFVLSLVVHPDGGLWLGTDRGVTLFRRGEFSNFTTNEGMAGETILSLCVDGEGAVWAGGDRGVYRIKDGLVTTFHPGGNGSRCRDLASDRSGRIWAMPEAGELFYFENGQFQKEDLGLKEQDVFQGFFEDSRKSIWIGRLYKGLVRRDAKGVSTFLKKKDLPSADLVSRGIVEDAAGHLWFSFPPIGLVRYADGKFEQFGREQGLPSVQVRSLFMDREDNLWVGTSDSGLTWLRPKSIQNLNEQQGLRLYMGRAICNDETTGGLWLANEHDGLYQFDQGKFTKVSGAAGGSLWTLLRTRGKALIAGKYPHGLAWLPALPPFPEALKHPKFGHIRSIIEDRKDGIWIGTENGVYHDPAGKLASFTRVEGVTGVNFSSLLEDREGAIWAGAPVGGLFRIKGEKVEAFGLGQGLRSAATRSLHQDDDGAIWVGTPRGLSTYRDGAFKTVGLAEGLEDERINQILDDGLGNLWLGTPTGIYRSSKKDLEACLAGATRSVFPLSFRKQAGLLSLECRHASQPTSVRGLDGKLYFLTLKGVAVIDPRKISSKTFPPTVVFERVTVDGIEVISPFNFRRATPLVIPPGSLRMEYHFAGVSLSDPERLHYRYRLQSYDETWVESGSRRFASYTKVPPGEYQFKVSARIGDGPWNDAGASMAVVVQPYFWQTAWFESLSALAFLAVALALYKNRIRQLERRRIQQETFSRELIASQERERKRLASEIHDGLGQNLLIIKNRAEAATEGQDAVTIAEQLHEITQSALEAIQEVRTIAHNLRPYQLDRLGLTMALQSMAKHFASPGIALAAEIGSVDKILPPEHEINFYRIVQETLNNIGKHSGAKNAWLTIIREPARVLVTIRDDGRGFDFHATMSDPASKRGLGLTGLMERARSMGADLKFDSMPGRGTRVTLVVPILAQEKRA